MCSREGAKAQRCRIRPIVVVSTPAAAVENGVKRRSTPPHTRHLRASAPSREYLDVPPDTIVAKGPGVDVFAQRRRAAESKKQVWPALPTAALLWRSRPSKAAFAGALTGSERPPRSYSPRLRASARKNRRRPKQSPSRPAYPRPKNKRKGRPACADLPDLHSVVDPRIDWRKSYWPEPGP